jgi:GNAT superfamily N-acetyltransferase
VTGLVPSGVRAAGDADVAAVREISEAYDNLRPWPDRPDFLDHERRHGRMVVAERDGDVVAFGGSFDRGDVVYLADLFVRPAFLGHGIGAAVLESIFDRDGVRLTAASNDPRALPLYARFGMRPVLPVLYLHAPAVSLGPLDADPASLSPGALSDIAQLDEEVSGRPRPQEHEFLASLPGVEGVVVDGPGGAAAYAWIRTVTIAGPAGHERHAFAGPMGGRTERDMDGLTRAVAARAAGGADHVHLVVLGPHPSLVALFDAGFRLVDRDTWMCSRLDLVDGRRYAPSPELG